MTENFSLIAHLQKNLCLLNYTHNYVKALVQVLYVCEIKASGMQPSAFISRKAQVK